MVRICGIRQSLDEEPLAREAATVSLWPGPPRAAWRCLAMACRDPLSTLRNLRIAYSRNIFTAQDTPVSVAALQKNVNDFIEER